MKNSLLLLLRGDKTLFPIMVLYFAAGKILMESEVFLKQRWRECIEMEIRNIATRLYI